MDFVVYRELKIARRHQRLEESPRANELVCLHEINEWNVQCFYFDGLIRHGGKDEYVQGIPFELLSIGGYGELSHPNLSVDIWIQSKNGKKYGIWYHLLSPAEEYRAYHASFLWMAQLSIYTVNYLSIHEHVTLGDFQARFHKWLKGLYLSADVDKWLAAYGRDDFRHAVVSQANFLWCQAIQVQSELERQPLWAEIHPRFLTAISERSEQSTSSDMFAEVSDGGVVKRRKTTVTPYVFNCFKHLLLARFLYCQTPTCGKGSNDEERGNSGHLRPNPQVFDATNCSSEYGITVDIGEVVALTADTTTTWKSKDKHWFGYVQDISDSEQGPALGLLWLYRPSDTVCLEVPYPHPKELFLSDHCNCGDKPILAQEIVYKPRVAFSLNTPTGSFDYFIRQRYLEADGAWETLKDSDFECSCKSNRITSHYAVGDTLLVKIKSALEPVILIEMNPEGLTGKLKVRRFLRKRRDYHDLKAAANELVLTDRLLVVPEAHVDRDCMIRFYSEDEMQQGKIAAPYNRGGTGDFYFVISQDLDGNGPRPFSTRKPLVTIMTEGGDPLHVPSQPLPMSGLDLFCGGGNFGRGLEEGKAVRFRWAVDWNTEALHTYKANLKRDEDAVELYLGSVNDYLTQALQGKGAPSVAQQGEVAVIAAGSPCQGFSLANPLKGNDGSLINMSMVASVISYIDFYRPKYALLENVKGMATGTTTENMLALVISALLGMGYQVRTFALDAWNFGSPQSRSRIIVSVAAPGLKPISEPPHTHSHPEDIRSASLGSTANGLRSNSRYTSLTPFRYISSEEATRDLPSTNARISCIPFPDHRTSRPLSTRAKIQIGSIPRFPGGCNFIAAMARGYMPQNQIDSYPWQNKIMAAPGCTSWRRVRRGALMPTIMTEPRPDDGTNGQCLHWDQHRLLTIMEARRAQGVPDDEVLVGLPADQWKIVGNSVARPMALALGLSLRKAWLHNNEDEEVRVGNLAEELQTTAIHSEVQHTSISDTAPVKPLESAIHSERHYISVSDTDSPKSEPNGRSSNQSRTYRTRTPSPDFDELVVVKTNVVSKISINHNDGYRKSRMLG